MGYRMSDSLVLVVGTTSDYISYIYERYPGRALFLTDLTQRVGSVENAPDKASEIVCQLINKTGVLNALHKHLENSNQTLSGIVCYDCEWLSLAAELAEHYDLPFPSAKSVKICRDKFHTKKKWTEYGVRCPKMQLIEKEWQTPELIDQLGLSVVLKPLTGTGSELTFLCHDKYDLIAAFRAIRNGLEGRSESPLYKLNQEDLNQQTIDPSVLAEEFIEGREYSADFIINDNEVDIIRIAKKIRGDYLPFGTTKAYVVPARMPRWLNQNFLVEKLREAAQALGLTRAICMVDFIVSKEEIVFLELSPRIGGDCLPTLILNSCGLDTIGLALDFAENKKTKIPPPLQWTELVAMRLFSLNSGTLLNVNCKELFEDPRVREIFIKHAPGHEITIPPEDYDSWLLGQVIFEPQSNVSIGMQCKDLEAKIIIDVEQYRDQKIDWPFRENCGDAQQAGPPA